LSIVCYRHVGPRFSKQMNDQVLVVKTTLHQQNTTIQITPNM
jgi:hypothetical protein